MRSLLGLFPLMLVACQNTNDTGAVEPDTEPDTDTEVGTDADTSGATACQPALAATGGLVGVTQLFTVEATGGTGDYRFDTLDDGQINPLSGVFFAPREPGDQRVVVTDAGCDGSAEAVVEVVPRLAVFPSTASVLPGTSMDLDVVGGSGLWTCELFFGDGRVSDDCQITVPLTGSLIVRVVDDITGDAVDATLTADGNAGFSIDPSQMVVLPVGALRSVDVLGGTGFLAMESRDPSVVSVAGDALVGESAGAATVLVQDAYTGESHVLQVQVVQPLAVPLGDQFGGNTRQNQVVQPGDIDGDGAEDVFFGDWEVSSESYRGGAVVHIDVLDLGVASLDSLYPGTWIDERVGSGLALMDADADGLDDLVVSALLPDDIANDSGRVDIYRRTDTGFEDTPFMRLYGSAGERHGEGVGACDLNGDSYDDLIVGVTRDEDRTQANIAGDQGALWVYYGGPAGLEDIPSEVRYGRAWRDGEWTHTAGLLLGARIVTGDVNGDGLCDVAAAQPARRLSVEGINGGYVHLYLGHAEEGLEPFPARSFEENVIANELGYTLAMGDLDDDGLDELVIGHPRMELGDERDRGAVYVYRSGGLELDLPQGTALVRGDQADWTARGSNNSDFLGDAVRIDDADGDGDPDLFIGVAFSEYGGQTGGSGDVVAFLSDGIAQDIADGVAERIASDADHIYNGPDTGAAIGSGFAVVDDFDDDGWRDLLARGPRDDTLGPDFGQYWLLSSDPEGMQTPLGYAGVASGHRVGESVGGAVVDGQPVMLVGSPDVALDGLVRPGQVSAIDPQTGAVLWAPSRHTTQSGGDRNGWSLSPAGDVDGDGLGPDLVVAGYEDERNGNLTPYNTPDCTVPTGGNAGSVMVYRRMQDGLWQDAPSAIFYGPAANSRAWRTTGGYDFNGDGLDDVVMSGDVWYGDNLGGVRVQFGRPLESGLELLCDPLDLMGVEGQARFGRSIAGIDDLDGDGCDELAVGAYVEDLSDTDSFLNAQGVVRVFFGLGEQCTTRGVVTLMSQEANAQAGFALASGDLDGDGLMDVAVGVRQTRPDVNVVGSVWVLPGAELASLATEPWMWPFDDAAVVPPNTEVNPVIMTRSSDSGLAVWGRQNANFGDAVAIIPSASSDSGMALAVGAPFDDTDGLDSGEVVVYRWVAGEGLDPVPMVRATGDVVSARTGASIGGAGGFLIYGAPFSHALGPDRGAAFAVELP